MHKTNIVHHPYKVEAAIPVHLSNSDFWPPAVQMQQEFKKYLNSFYFLKLSV